MTIRLAVLLLLFTSRLTTVAQPDSVAYTRDYVFTEGIYLKYDNFKQNNPITKDQILIDYPKTESDFIEQVIMQKTITYRDSQGKTNEIETSKIWGFSTNNKVFKSYKMYAKNSFSELKLIGTLCYLGYSQTNSNSNSNIANTHAYTNNNTLINIQKTKYYIYDTQTRRYLLDSKDLIEFFKERDQELFNEYTSLSYSKRENTVFIYIKKYNEKHPLYLPK